MSESELIPHLFRTEYSKIVSVLVKHFGFDRIEIAEDIAGDTFLTASETWGLKGIPDNPRAWLYTVAKNKAKNVLHRDSLFVNKVVPALKNNSSHTVQKEIDLSPQNIKDSQLRMMFAICHPSIPAESQIGLSLRILCGFGIDEIADAFLTNNETINKRLYRAKKILRESNIKIEIPGAVEIENRLETVLTTIYLLFNEGYYSTSQNMIIRKDLCLESLRLCHMLVENENTNTPSANALLSLMCFHSSRFEARINASGELILYADQDTGQWNMELIQKGEYFLNRSASGNKISKYHLEAAIAWWHTQKDDTKVKWEHILQLYNQLLQLEYSPVAALNRTFALSKANGKEEAIAEAGKLQLKDNHFYFVLLGELYKDIDPEISKRHFQKGLSLARTQADKHIIQKKIDEL